MSYKLIPQTLKEKIEKYTYVDPNKLNEKITYKSNASMILGIQILFDVVLKS